MTDTTPRSTVRSIYEYDPEEGWIVETDANGASQIVAAKVQYPFGLWVGRAARAEAPTLDALRLGVAIDEASEDSAWNGDVYHLTFRIPEGETPTTSIGQQVRAALAGDSR